MLDHCLVLRKNGVLLWRQSWAPMKGNPLDDLIRTMLMGLKTVIWCISNYKINVDGVTLRRNLAVGTHCMLGCSSCCGKWEVTYANFETGGADQGVDLGHAAGAGADHEHGLGHG